MNQKQWIALVASVILVAGCDLPFVSLSSESSTSASSASLSSTTSATSGDASESTSTSQTISSGGSSNGTSLPSEVTIDLYSINDFHGAVEFNQGNSEPGISRLAAFFAAREAINPSGTVKLGTGDLWQGSADSNLTKGRLVTDALNLMNFDAMSIGNHEFDWTDSYIISNRERAEYPFLAANIFDKRTDQLASFCEPYTLIERQGVQIGIIGIIGASLESTILASAVMNYDFRPATQLVADYATTLRGEGADLIVLMNHDGSVDSGVLPYVDAVFNGHTHQFENTTSGGKPVMQASYNGKGVANIRFKYSHISNSLTYLTSIMYQNMIQLTPDEGMENLYQSYLISEINAVKNEEVGFADGNFSTGNLARLAVREMLAFGVDYGAKVSFHNSGGVRASIPSGTVTYGEIYKAFPFDNELMVVEVTGSQLKTWLSYGIVYEGVSVLTYQFTDGTTIVNSSIYKIISINYLTEKNWANSSSYPHDQSTALNTFQYVRELIRQKWLAAGTLSSSDY